MPNTREREMVFQNPEVTIYTDVIDSLSTGKPIKRYVIEFTSGSGEWNFLASRCLFDREEVIDYVISKLQKYEADNLNCIYPVNPIEHRRRYKNLLNNI